jgi:hypothetical protein
MTATEELPEIVFAPLPPDSSGRHLIRWPDRLAPLRDNPGQWACIGRMSGSVAYAIKNGKHNGIRAGDYVATTRNKEGHMADIWVKYVGPVIAK